MSTDALRETRSTAPLSPPRGFTPQPNIPSPPGCQRQAHPPRDDAASKQLTVCGRVQRRVRPVVGLDREEKRLQRAKPGGGPRSPNGDGLHRKDSEIGYFSHVAPSVASEHCSELLGSPIPCPSPLSTPVSNQGPFPPPALPGFPGTTNLSATPSRPI